MQATPGESYAAAPTSWDLPSGERIHIDVHRASVTSGFGMYTANVAFTATLDRDSIYCESEPVAPRVPRTRFGCWAIGETEPLTFWLAPGEDCPARHIGHAATLTTPSCWNGQASLGEQSARLRHGYLKSTGSPVGYISWVSAKDEPLLAADIVLQTRVRVYEPKPELATAVRRRLLLLTIALAWWEHAARPR